MWSCGAGHKCVPMPALFGHDWHLSGASLGGTGAGNPLSWVWELQWESHSNAALCREKCDCKRRHCRERHRTHTPRTPTFISIHGFLIGWWGPFFLNSCVNRFGMWHRLDINISPIFNTPTQQLSSKRLIRQCLSLSLLPQLWKKLNILVLPCSRFLYFTLENLCLLRDS